MYEYFLSAAESFIRYGMSPTALVVALIAFFKTKRFKRFISRRAPMLFKDDADVLNYQSRQIRIESKLDALMSKEGVVWGAHLESTLESQKIMSLKKKSLLSSLAGLSHAVTIGVFTTLTGHFNHSKIREESTQMKKKLLSRKFILALATGILVILNDGLDLGLQTETIMYVVGIVATWIVGEAAVDVSRKSPDTSDIEKSYHGE